MIAELLLAAILADLFRRGWAYSRNQHVPRATRLLPEPRTFGDPPPRPVPPWCGCGQDAEVMSVRRIGETRPLHAVCIRCGSAPSAYKPAPVSIPIAGPGADRS